MSIAKLPQLAPIDRTTSLRASVVERILHAVFQGHLQAGDRLIVQKLAAQFGVSATPVREALVELSGIGVVRMLPNRGAVCEPFGPDQLREIYHIRRVLETEATRCACGQIAHEELQHLHDQMLALERHQRRSISEQAMVLDSQLHNLISNCCGNGQLAHEIERYNTLLQSLRKITNNLNYVQSRAIEEHVQIIDALLKEDEGEAAEAMSRHIASTAKGVEQVMFPSDDGGNV